MPVCRPCQNGDHCGPPGQAGPSCPCQHRPPGTGQTARRMAAHHIYPDVPPFVITTEDVTEAVAEAVAEELRLTRECLDNGECCPDACRLDAVRARLSAWRTPDDPDPQADADEPTDDASDVLKDTPTVELMRAWTRHHSSGAFTAAASLRRVLVDRFNRQEGNQ